MNNTVLEMTRNGITLDETAVAAFQGSLRGTLLQPGDSGYDEARQLYNGMIDKRPRLIARCVDAADVMASVNFARENSMLLACAAAATTALAWAAAMMAW